MKANIYCTIIAALILMIYPFPSRLIWIPAANFEQSYQAYLTNSKTAQNYQLEIKIANQEFKISSDQLKDADRILALLKESGSFSEPNLNDEAFITIVLRLNSQNFQTSLNYSDFRANMPLQMAINLLITQNLMPLAVK